MRNKTGKYHRNSRQSLERRIGWRISCGLAFAFCVAAASAWAAEEYTLTQGGWALELSPDGCVVRCMDAAGRDLATDLDALRVGVGAAPDEGVWHAADSPLAACAKPNRVENRGDTVVFEYDLTTICPLLVHYEVSFVSVGTLPCIRRTVTLKPVVPPLNQDVALSVGIPIAIKGAAPRVFVPRQDGIGETIDLNADMCWTWPLDGGGHAMVSPAQHLAIPMLTVADNDESIRLTHIADPFFTTSFRLTPDGRNSCDCVYNGSAVALNGPVTRTFWTVIHAGPPEQAVDAWYATALADVPPGPAWLHDVAWQHYDYLSHGGRGWFADIDAVAQRAPAEDRPKIVFTLHGWYDMLGRYTFDIATGRLDDAWTAFPNAAAVKDKGFGTSESVSLTKAAMHERIRYAKDRGFRVALYFADGLTACEGAGLFDESKLIRWGGWVGPDTVGRPYMQNPAHPAVFDWYCAYLKALLTEYGQEIDALVWDETFMIRAGMTAPPSAPEPAYLCGAMMRLVRELTLLTTAARGDLAFLVSDCVGMTTDEKSFWTDVPPYAIMGHGCYQDSHSRPSVWPYGLFPNLRNVLWSCNWSAVTRFDYTAFGVEHYDTPVATSNGWLDDRGFAALTEVQREAVLDLFNKRKMHPQTLRWLDGPAPVFTGLK